MNIIKKMPRYAQIGIAVLLVAAAVVTTIALVPHNAPVTVEPTQIVPAAAVMAPKVADKIDTVSTASQNLAAGISIDVIYESPMDEVKADSATFWIESNGYKTLTDKYGITHWTNDPNNPAFAQFNP